MGYHGHEETMRDYSTGCGCSWRTGLSADEVLLIEAHRKNILEQKRLARLANEPEREKLRAEIAAAKARLEELEE